MKTLLRAVLGAVFVLSGVLKAAAPDRFLIDTHAFGITPYFASYLTAVFLPWLEIAAGAALIFKRALLGASSLLGGLTAVFIAAILMVWIRGVDLNCGCFGDWLVFTSYPGHIGFNLLLLAGLLFICREAAREEKRARASGP